MTDLQLPNGLTYRFGDVAYSKRVIQFVNIMEAGARNDGKVSSSDMLRIVSLGWELTVEAIANGGRVEVDESQPDGLRIVTLTREEAEAAMEGVPFTKEWLAKLQNALNLL